MEELPGTCNCQFKSMGGVVLLWVLRSGEGEEDEGGGRSSDSGDGLGPSVEGEGRTATARHLPASFAASSPSYPLLFVLRDTAPATVACCLPLPSLHANHCLTRLVLNIISRDRGTEKIYLSRRCKCCPPPPQGQGEERCLCGFSAARGEDCCVQPAQECQEVLLGDD
uniref:Uncharacterized protein n=1 Tax=Triticum urartu TaxID=4572 RepID=A0A8R7R1V0_TRIUA